MLVRTCRGLVAIVLLVASVLPVAADPSAPAVAPGGAPAIETRREPPTAVTAESEYNRGIRARLAKDWRTAEQAFRKAIAIRAEFPEAWNELGFALRNRGRYPESIKAYDEALRLRPDFPEALEYLGEAYVKMRRLDDARRILDRLRPLDPARAQELAEAIAQGK